MDFNCFREEGVREVIVKCKSFFFNYIIGNKYMKDVFVLKLLLNKKVVKFRCNTYLYKIYIFVLFIFFFYVFGYLYVISEM